MPVRPRLLPVRSGRTDHDLRRVPRLPRSDRLRTLFLETSANTYSSLLGPIQSSTQRINFSQIFNSLGVISGVLIGQLMVFGENDPSHEQLLAMPASAADIARHQMVSQVVGPYLIIGSVLVVLALVFVFIKFPSCKGAPAQQQQLPTESMGPTLKRLFAIPRFRLDPVAVLYVGARLAYGASRFALCSSCSKAPASTPRLTGCWLLW